MNKNYQKLKLQNSHPDLARIRVINPSDVGIKESLKNLGFSELEIRTDLGICDPDEVRERNHLMHLLFDNPELRESIKSLNHDSFRLKVPSNENDFLWFYNQQENPYWSGVKKVVELLQKAKANNPGKFPKSMEQFLLDLLEALPIESNETTFSKRVAAQLENVALMEGIFSIDIFWDEEDGQFHVGRSNFSYIHGYKLFNISYATEYSVRLAKWIKSGFYRSLGITKLVERIAKKRKKEMARRSAVINSYTNNLEEDLANGFENTVMRYLRTRKPVTKGGDITFTCYFSYGKKGLRLMPIAAEQPGFKRFSFKLDFDLSTATPQQKKAIKKRSGKIDDLMNQALTGAKTLGVYASLPDDFFGKSVRIDSTGTDRDFRWFALGQMYHHKTFRTIFEEIDSQREYFFDVIRQLNDVSEKISKFEEKAAAQNYDLCIPEISFVKHSGVHFVDMVPISLIGETNKLVPISLDRINGQMVGLTGHHGGGKTVAGKAILENVFLAISGMPVFAKKFSTDVKTVLGAVTNDSGDGSTATVFIKKVMSLMQEISVVSVDESLIFIDEIGKGTQQESGLGLGKDILTALKKGGNSVLFNTQILELAKYAQDNLNAACYKVDENHQFVRGIAGGNIEKLVKEIGLDKFLEN